MFVLSFLSYLNQIKICCNVCNDILFVFKAFLMLKYEKQLSFSFFNLYTQDVTSMYNHTPF